MGKSLLPAVDAAENERGRGAQQPTPSKVWLVWASQGEYSDRSEWPVCAFWSEQAAKDNCLKRLFAWRAADAVGRDEDGQTPDYDTPEDKARRGAFEALGDGSLDSFSGEPRYHACEIDVLGDGVGQGPTSTTDADEARNMNTEAPGDGQ